MKMVLGFKQSLALTIAGNWAASWMRATKMDHDLATCRLSVSPTACTTSPSP